MTPASIPPLIRGAWQLAGGHGPVDRARAIADMQEFVDAGLTAFDCADIYTGVEDLIGEYLRQRSPGSLRPRVHTKCVPDRDLLGTLTPADLDRTIDRSRQRLGLETLDLVQFHWWDYERGDPVAAARHLAALREAGVVAELGATNFSTTWLKRLLDHGIPITTHQVQYSLLDRRPAGGMAALCRANGVKLLCYGALAGGFLHERWLGAPPPAEPVENRSLIKYRLIIEEFGGWEAYQSLLRALAGIAQRHGTTIGAVAIRWVLDQPMVGSVIVGARHAGHLPATVAALTLRLDAADHGRLAPLLAAAPGPAGDVYDLEREPGGRHGAIMRYNLNGGRR